MRRDPGWKLNFSSAAWLIVGGNHGWICFSLSCVCGGDREGDFFIDACHHGVDTAPPTAGFKRMLAGTFTASQRFLFIRFDGAEQSTANGGFSFELLLIVEYYINN